MIEQLWIDGNRELEAWRTAPLRDLILHIVEHYHLDARIQMARMETFAAQAVLLNAACHPVLLEVREQVGCFCIEFLAHLALEEQELFPYILGQSRCHGAPATGPGALMQPLKKLLEDEHQAEMGVFLRLRELTEEFTPVGDNPSPQTKLYESCKTLEDSLQRHIFLENQILFPRAL